MLFDSDLTPAGKNLLDGRYSCFGYTTDGARLLSDVKEGDLITSAKVSAPGGDVARGAVRGLARVRSVSDPFLIVPLFFLTRTNMAGHY